MTKLALLFIALSFHTAAASPITDAQQLVAQTTHTALAPRVLVLDQNLTGLVRAYAEPTRIVAGPYAYKQINRRTEMGAYLALHEAAHRPDVMYCTPSYYEEGIADALARDLHPTLVARWGGDVHSYVSYAYDPNVVTIRTRSSLATGKPYRSRAARLWRRTLWASNCEQRATMLGY